MGKYYDDDEAEETTSKKSDLKINKRMRMWNRYKNLFIGGVAIVIILIFFVIILKSCSNNSPEAEINSKPTVNETATSKLVNGEDITKNSNENQTKAPSQAETNPSQQETTQATTAASGNSVYTTNKTVEKQDVTSKDYYSNSIILGDALANGFEYYKYLDDSRVVSNNNMTVAKGGDYIDEVVSANPDKVFVTLGINDLNNGFSTNTIVDTTAKNYESLIGSIKSKLPNSKIYIVSVLPITKAYESKTTVYITKANIDSLNSKLQAIAEKTDNVAYVNIASAYTDSTGYLTSSVTNNGLNIASGYYGFMLNTIAEMVK